MRSKVRRLVLAALLGALLAQATPASPPEEQRAPLRLIDRDRLQRLERSFSEASRELRGSAELEFLTKEGKQELARTLREYKNCTGSTEFCAEKRAAAVAAAAVFFDAAWRLVNDFEQKLDIDPRTRYELGRLIRPGPDGRAVPDRTSESLQVLLDAGGGEGGSPGLDPDVSSELLRHFVNLTDLIYDGPGGQFELLARQIQGLQSYRLMYGLYRRYLVVVARHEEIEVSLDQFGAPVAPLDEQLGDDLRVIVPDFTSSPEKHTDTIRSTQDWFRRKE